MGEIAKKKQPEGVRFLLIQHSNYNAILSKYTPSDRVISHELRENAAYHSFYFRITSLIVLGNWLNVPQNVEKKFQGNW